MDKNISEKLYYLILYQNLDGLNLPSILEKMIKSQGRTYKILQMTDDLKN